MNKKILGNLHILLIISTFVVSGLAIADAGGRGPGGGRGNRPGQGDGRQGGAPQARDGGNKAIQKGEGRRDGSQGRGDGGKVNAVPSGGHNIQRGPSMSRISTPRATGGPIHNVNPSMPQQRPINQKPVGKTQTRNEVQNFLRHRPSAQPVQRSADKTNIHSGRLKGEDSVRQAANRNKTGQNIRDQVRTDGHRNGEWFNRQFWNRHRTYPSYYNYPVNWWNWATPVGVTGWLGWNAAPIYYDYSYENGSDWTPYYDTGIPQGYIQPVPMPPAPSEQIGGNEWMPLGVFGLSYAGDVTALTNIYFQLTVSREGQISGVYYNAITDQAYEVEGLVDQNTQMAAWKGIDVENSPLFETGIFNLTQPEAPVLLHFIDGATQEMLLVRLDDQNEGQEP